MRKILHGSYTPIIFWYIPLLNLILNSKLFQRGYLRAILSRKDITSKFVFINYFLTSDIMHCPSLLLAVLWSGCQQLLALH
jgi:hypothetical protein